MKEKYVFFWGGIYSQWYIAPMVIDNIKYTSCEQYMMHQKALLFGDNEIAELIMKTDSPRNQKELGRKVSNFDRAVWDSHCFSIVYTGNLAKFTQNPKLGFELLATGDKILVEASPEDKIWGIGMINSEGVDNPKNWKGFNLLGWAITCVKHEIENNDLVNPT